MERTTENKNKIDQILEACDGDVQNMRGVGWKMERDFMFNYFSDSPEKNVGITRLNDLLIEHFGVSKRNCLAVQHNALNERLQTFQEKEERK